MKNPTKFWTCPLVIAQVTLFSCGGFSFGLRLCHCICDGLGAWAAKAKTGELVTKPGPIWDRGFFRPRDPPMVKHPHLEFMRIDKGSSLTMSLWTAKPVQKCYRISREFQCWLKSLLYLRCGGGSHLAVVGESSRCKTTRLQTPVKTFSQCSPETEKPIIKRRVFTVTSSVWHVRLAPSTILVTGRSDTTVWFQMLGWAYRRSI
ncbi:hypothetical protein SLE2022_266560 [Rubroshorea leprosula]